MKRYLYKNTASSLLHHKSGDGTENLVMPITMYRNIINAPHYVDNIVTEYGAEFLLMKNESIEITDDTMNRMIKNVDIDY